MTLQNDFIFAKLQDDLHPSFLSRLMTFNWVHQAEQAILGALTISRDATMAHACHLVVHGESVYHSLRFLEAIALEISSLLAAEGAAVEWEKEEINSRILTTFGWHHSALCILDGRGSELHHINHLWMEARDLLSLGIHAFNGVWSNLTALSEHQSGPRAACLHLPADKQDCSLKGWVGRLKAQRALMPARVGVPFSTHLILPNILFQVH